MIFLNHLFDGGLLMKWVLRLFGLLVVLITVIAVVGFFYLETTVVREAEKIASRELGVPVNIGGMTIGWMSKSVSIQRIKVGNPDGFETPYFVEIPQVDIQVSEAILGDPLIIDSVGVSGLTAYYEVNESGNNLRKIQQNMLKSSQSKLSKAQKTEGDSKGFVIKDLRISAAVLVPAISIAGQGGSQSIPIPLIHLRNLGSESKPTTSREVVLRVMTSLTGVIQNSALPKLITNQIADEAVKGINKAKDAIGGAIDGLFGK